MRVAQTNLQLYNQLRARGLELDDLVLVHRAYELLTTLYPGHFQADGKPFVAHGVGVASVLAEIGQPAEILAVGLLHNVYGNADFGDGAGPGRTPSRRLLVRDAVGHRVEELIFRFADLRITPSTIAGMRASLPERDATDRSLLLVDLADQVEKYVDLGVLYFGQGDWIVNSTGRLEAQLVELANELGEPRLGEMLSTVMAEAEAEAGRVPPELRPSDGRRYLKLVVPRSCERRVERVPLVRRIRARVRLRTRLAALIQG
jgi:Domain of unknown function (DUF6817)